MLFKLWCVTKVLESVVLSVISIPVALIGMITYKICDKHILIEDNKHNVYLKGLIGNYACINPENGDIYMTPELFILSKLGLFKGTIYHEYGHYKSKAPDTEEWWSRRLSEIRADLISVKLLKKHFNNTAIVKAVIVLEFILDYILGFEWLSRPIKMWMDEHDRSNPNIVPDTHPTDLSRLKYMLKYANSLS